MSNTSCQKVTVSLTLDQWVLRYGYAVAKSHRYDSAYMLGSLLDVDIVGKYGDPCDKEEFEKRLRDKYLSSAQSEKNGKQE